MRTSVSALVTEHLREFATTPATKNVALAKLLEEFRESRKNGPHFSASDRLSREDLYDRDARRREYEESLREEQMPSKE